MVHTYQITGMTCSSCVAKVTSALMQLKEVNDVKVSMEKNTVTITMVKHLSIPDLQRAVPDKYKISAPLTEESEDSKKAWFVTYKPLFIIFSYLVLIIFLVQLKNDNFSMMVSMQFFMAGFFLIFSFFKFLDLKGFAESYVRYDIIASRFQGWAYLYVFIELALGLAYLINIQPIWINTITFVVMSISIIGVLQSVINKKKIQCACLGSIFNLPMSTVTIIEDGLMIAMSAWMLTVIT